MDHLRDKEGMQLLRSKEPKLPPTLREGGESVAISKTWFSPWSKRGPFDLLKRGWGKEFHKQKHKDFQVEDNTNSLACPIYLSIFTKTFNPKSSKLKKKKKEEEEEEGKKKERIITILQKLFWHSLKCISTPWLCLLLVVDLVCPFHNPRWSVRKEGTLKYWYNNKQLRGTLYFQG